MLKISTNDGDILISANNICDQKCRIKNGFTYVCPENGRSFSTSDSRFNFLQKIES